MSRSLLALFLCLPTCFIMAQPADVTGWNKVKWGMKISAAKAFYPTAEEHLYGHKQKELDAEIHLGEYLGQAAIEAHEAGLIQAVEISSGKINDSPKVRADQFDIIKSQLIQRYGQPKSDERRQDPRATAQEGDTVRNLLWIFPSTTILLKWEECYSMPIGSLMVTFKPKERSHI